MDRPPAGRVPLGLLTRVASTRDRIVQSLLRYSVGALSAVFRYPTEGPIWFGILHQLLRARSENVATFFEPAYLEVLLNLPARWSGRLGRRQVRLLYRAITALAPAAWPVAAYWVAKGHVRNGCYHSGCRAEDADLGAMWRTLLQRPEAHFRYLLPHYWISFLDTCRGPASDRLPVWKETKQQWAAFFEGLGIATPPILAVVEDGELSNEIPECSLFGKPDSGSSGARSQALLYDGSHYQDARSAKRYDRAALLEHLRAGSRAGALVVQPLGIADGSTDTRWRPPPALRVYTLRRIEGTIEAWWIAWYAPGDRLTTNLSAGGRAFRVDPETGEAREWMYGDRREPLHGEVVDPSQLSAIVADCIRAHEALHRPVLMAFDIALAKQALWFLEGNINCGFRFDLSDPKMRERFEVDYATQMRAHLDRVARLPR